MGTDTPLACLSDQPQSLFNYFKQLFAQVTNPPIDPIREDLVMSLTSYIGTERNILAETPQHCHTLKMPHPILTNRDLEKLRRVSRGDLLASTLPMLFRAGDGEEGLKRALDQLCRRATLAIKSGYTLLILSDRGSRRRVCSHSEPAGADRGAQPLDARRIADTGGADHRIGRAARESCTSALLIGYGASAVNPYLAIETLESMAQKGELPGSISLSDGFKELQKSHQQRAAESLLKDGHLDAAELSRRAGV